MIRVTSQRIDELIFDAEQHGRLLAYATTSDRRALERRLGDGGLVEPRAGLFARASYWKKLDAAEQAMHVMRSLSTQHPDWTFCGVSAALVHGLPVTWSYLGTTHIVAGKRSKKRWPKGFAFHSVSKDAAEVVHGLRVTSFWRTVFDCLATMEEPDALAIADAALRMSNSRPQQLVAHFKQTYRRHAGVRTAIRRAWLADPLSESGGESIARAIMLDLGFEPPLLQVWIPDPLNPGKFYRGDFGWMRDDGTFVIGEHDGAEKSENPKLTRGRTKEQVLNDERLRESRLTAYGLNVVRFTPKIVRSRRKFETLLDEFRVPRRSSDKLEMPALTPRRSELIVAEDLTMLASVYDARDLRWNVASQPAPAV